MLFADFQSWLSQSFVIFILVLAWAIHTCMKANGAIASEIKGAATKKAIGFIGKLFK